MKVRLWKIVTGSLVAAVAIGCAVLFLPMDQDTGANPQGSNMLSLIKPPFVSAAGNGTNFLEEEAGISAYVNVGRGIDLDEARKALIGISSEGDSYLIGNVELEGLPEEEFPLVYIHKDGWILAYYTKYAPASRIMQWQGYDGGAVTTTTLEDAITKICPYIGVNYLQIQGSIKFYDFKYPNATTLILVADVIDEEGTDTFNFEIPFNVTLYEASWSHYVYSFSSYSYGASNTKIDNTTVSTFYAASTKGFLASGYYEKANLIAGMKHTVSIYRNSCTSWVGVAVVFIYAGV